MRDIACAFCLFFLAIISILSPRNLIAETAWWGFCDQCTTNYEFTLQAINSPQQYQTVFISNRNTNETRKYLVSTDQGFMDGQMGDSVSITTEAQRIALTPNEKTVFEQAIQNANISFVEIPRGELDGLAPGVGDESSVVGDIGSGGLPSTYSHAINRFIEQSGLLPSTSSVNQQLGVLSVEAAVGFTIRFKSLIIVIVYDDGSTVSLRRRPDGEFVEWVATDEDDVIIDLDIDSDGDIVIDPPNAGNGPNPETLVFRFGHDANLENDIRDLMNWFGLNTSWRCRSEILPDGVFRVTCSRSIQ